MAYLFVVEGNIVRPNTETLLVEPFKSIWERDESESKAVALKEFTFMEFMTSKKKTNPYSGYHRDARFLALRHEYFDDDWEPDDLVNAGVTKIEEFQKDASVTYRYYSAAVSAAEKMMKFFEEFDINERNNRDQPLYKPGEITRALNDTDKVLGNLSSMKEKVEQELFEITKTRGNKEINPFEV